MWPQWCQGPTRDVTRTPTHGDEARGQEVAELQAPLSQPRLTESHVKLHVASDLLAVRPAAPDSVADAAGRHLTQHGRHRARCTQQQQQQHHNAHPLLSPLSRLAGEMSLPWQNSQRPGDQRLGF